MKKTILLALSSLAAALTAQASDEPALHAQLREIARTYLKAQLVNPRPIVAPTLCRVPPTQVLHSKAKGEREHGGKLFYLFARQAAPLKQKARIEAQPAGQYLVKETWEAVKHEGTKRLPKGRHASGHFLSKSTTHKGKTLAIGKPLDLYMMLKQPETTAQNDVGWVYAVISRNGKTVRKAGRMRSCIDCHEDAKHDRILGDYGKARPLFLQRPQSK